MGHAPKIFVFQQLRQKKSPRADNLFGGQELKISAGDRYCASGVLYRGFAGWRGYFAAWLREGLEVPAT
jgi:hypothetical protein